MDAIIESKLGGVRGICTRRHVQRLAVFGSAARDGFDLSASDADVLVEFELMPPAQHADCYFGLQEDLEALFGLSVDVVEAAPIANPSFRESVERTKVVVYEA